MCIFESDTVKSDCPVQIFRKIMTFFKDLIQTVDIITRKKPSENDKLNGNFQSCFCFFRPPDPKSEKKNPPIPKSTNKKILP